MGALMVTLTESKVVDQWFTLLEGCQGEEEGLVRAVEHHLDRLKPPGANWKRDSAAPNMMSAVTGKTRDFLVVRHERFSDYIFCIGARDYGTALEVSWYLTGSTQGMILKLLSRIPVLGFFVAMYTMMRGRGLDTFDEQDLASYVAMTHQAVKHAVQHLVEQRKLDVAIDWKSKGVFAVA
jgi:hypothetical protein